MIYEFRTDFVVAPKESMLSPGPGNRPVSVSQLSHSQNGRTNIFTGQQNVDPYDIQEFIMPGFHALDEAMKMYWSGMRVPTKDSYRFCRMKVAGGDKSVLVWADDIKNGRAILPVGALNRLKFDFNKDRFSPPYMPMVINYPSRQAGRAIMVFRPVPVLVDYSLTILTTSKRDSETLLWQIMTRFNSLAVFKMYDGHLQGDVTLRWGGGTDQSDKEVAFDGERYIKTEYSMVAEAWLPIPERLVPVVLGKVFSIQSADGTVLQRAFGSTVA